MYVCVCVTGGCCGSTKKNTIVGGWSWAWWLVTDVQRLSLEVMTLNPMCESVETAQGVPLTVTGVAQCKIMKAEELLQTASEQFLGKTVKEIKSTVLQTLEGHLRAILGKSPFLVLYLVTKLIFRLKGNNYKLVGHKMDNSPPEPRVGTLEALFPQFSCRVIVLPSRGVGSPRISLSISLFQGHVIVTLTVDSHVHRKTNAKQQRDHVTSSKPITRFPLNRRELFC
uniref:Band 7 domain-containing protein n=1 Tax=Timema monikensis TaxID=170555 RepID=A0A7R9HPC6_9NEOP|nr:unnamed protein product [Timema monikensis]